MISKLTNNCKIHLILTSAQLWCGVDMKKSSASKIGIINTEESQPGEIVDHCWLGFDKSRQKDFLPWLYEADTGHRHRLGLKWEEGSRSKKEKRKGQSGVWYNGIEFDIFYIYFDIVQWKDVKHSSLIWHIPFDHLETFLLIILQLFCLNIKNVLCNHWETFLFNLFVKHFETYTRHRRYGPQRDRGLEWAKSAWRSWKLWLYEILVEIMVVNISLLCSDWRFSLQMANIKSAILHFCPSQGQRKAGLLVESRQCNKEGCSAIYGSLSSAFKGQIEELGNLFCALIDDNYFDVKIQVKVISLGQTVQVAIWHVFYQTFSNCQKYGLLSLSFCWSGHVPS